MAENPRNALPVLWEVGANENVERVERLRDDLRHVRERWNNRLILEDGTFGERYLNGGAEILLYLDGDRGLNHENVAIRVPAHRAVLEQHSAEPGVDVVDLCYGDDRNEVVMFVEIAQAGSRPKMQVRIPTRLYILNDVVSKFGQGLLYRSIRKRGVTRPCA